MRLKETDFEPRTIGDHIKKKRLELGLTQKAVAKLLHVTEFSIIHWEIGDHEPHDAPTLHRIIQFLGYDPLPDGTSIPDLLRAKRRQLGMGQRELAAQLGVDPSTITNWERGGTIMPNRYRHLIAAFLELPNHSTQQSMRKRWNTNHGRSTPDHNRDVLKGIRAREKSTSKHRR